MITSKWRMGFHLITDPKLTSMYSSNISHIHEFRRKNTNLHYLEYFRTLGELICLSCICSLIAWSFCSWVSVLLWRMTDRAVTERQLCDGQSSSKCLFLASIVISSDASRRLIVLLPNDDFRSPRIWIFDAEKWWNCGSSANEFLREWRIRRDARRPPGVVDMAFRLNVWRL